MAKGMGKIALLVLPAAAVLAAAVVMAWRKVEPDALAAVRYHGVLRIGYSVEPPYAWPDEQGRVTGEAVELARLVAARMGVERIEWRMADFGALLDGLRADTYDVVAASMFITPERQARADFSIPTLRVRQGLLVRRGNPLSLHSYPDVVVHASAVVAVLGGTVERRMFGGLGLPDRRLLVVSDAGAGVMALARGEADGLALTDVAVARLAATDSRFEAASPFVQPAPTPERPVEDCGYAFRPSADRLREEWNRHLRDILGSAEHLELLRRFGLSENNLPGSVAGEAP